MRTNDNEVVKSCKNPSTIDTVLKKIGNSFSVALYLPLLSEKLIF